MQSDLPVAHFKLTVFRFLKLKCWSFLFFVYCTYLTVLYFSVLKCSEKIKSTSYEQSSARRLLGLNNTVTSKVHVTPSCWVTLPTLIYCLFNACFFACLNIQRAYHVKCMFNKIKFVYGRRPCQILFTFK